MWKGVLISAAVAALFVGGQNSALACDSTNAQLTTSCGTTTTTTTTSARHDQQSKGQQDKQSETKSQSRKDSDHRATQKNDNDDKNKSNEKVTICHATGSSTNPFVQITISKNGLNGHDHHDDIIPAPAGGCPTAAAGQVSPSHKDKDRDDPKVVKVSEKDFIDCDQLIAKIIEKHHRDLTVVSVPVMKIDEQKVVFHDVKLEVMKSRLTFAVITRTELVTLQPNVTIMIAMPQSTPVATQFVDITGALPVGLFINGVEITDHANVTVLKIDAQAETPMVKIFVNGQEVSGSTTVMVTPPTQTALSLVIQSPTSIQDALASQMLPVAAQGQVDAASTTPAPVGQVDAASTTPATTEPMGQVDAASTTPAPVDQADAAMISPANTAAPAPAAAGNGGLLGATQDASPWLALMLVVVVLGGIAGARFTTRSQR